MRKGLDIVVMLISIVLFIGLILVNIAALRADDVVNLKEIGAEADERNLPIMLLFVDSDCDDCVTITEEIIEPMIISGDYKNKIIIQYINLDEDKIIDFNGKESNADRIANRYNLELTPTVSFVNDKGIEFVEPISGMSNLDYYGSLLDESIDKALRKLRDINRSN